MNRDALVAGAIQVIRKFVPRPDKPPQDAEKPWGLGPHLCWRDESGVECCPMGMLTKYIGNDFFPMPVPSLGLPYYFKGVIMPMNEGEFESFIEWFDEQTDPDYVMEEIWPQESKVE